MDQIVYWGTIKKPLKPEDVDHNFRLLEQRIQEIKDKANGGISFENKGFTKIVQRQNHLDFYKQHEDEPFSIDLTALHQPYTYAGNWRPNVHYIKDTLVQKKMAILKCVHTHKSCPEGDDALWEVIFSFDFSELTDYIKGQWQSNKKYKKGDIVQVLLSLYCCVQDHVSSQEWHDNDLNWTMIFGVEQDK